MARRRSSGGDPIHGLLLLDKPYGISSNAALQQAKRIFKAKKAGHTGSLDPLASGLLVVCFGHATRLSSYLLDADKRYRVEVCLGVKTSSGDAEGEVIASQSVPDLSTEQVNQVLAQFKGAIEQVPPMYSALKREGVPLYKLARQGIEVERAIRKIIIYELDLCARPAADKLALDVYCSKGTYIRTLAEDIGDAIGCGAHISALRRTRVGDFKLCNAFTIDALQAKAKQAALSDCLLPLDQAIMSWPSVSLSAAQLYYAQQGQAVAVSDLPAEVWVRLYAENSALVGIGEVRQDGKLAPRRMFINEPVEGK